MLVEWRAGDALLGMKAVGGYLKGLESAGKACGKVYVDTMAIDAASMNAEKAQIWLREVEDEWQPGEVREVEIPSEHTYPLRLALTVYMTQLDKLAETEIDLLISTDETKERQSQARSLSDRLRGQIELGNLITKGIQDAVQAGGENPDDDQSTMMSINGGPAVPMEQFERGVRNLSRAR